MAVDISFRAAAPSAPAAALVSSSAAVAARLSLHEAARRGYAGCAAQLLRFGFGLGPDAREPRGVGGVGAAASCGATPQCACARARVSATREATTAVSLMPRRDDDAVSDDDADDTAEGATTARRSRGAAVSLDQFLDCAAALVEGGASPSLESAHGDSALSAALLADDDAMARALMTPARPVRNDVRAGPPPPSASARARAAALATARARSGGSRPPRSPAQCLLQRWPAGASRRPP